MHEQVEPEQIEREPLISEHQKITDLKAGIQGINRRVKLLQTEFPKGGRAFAVAMTKLDEARMWLDEASVDIN